MGTAASTHYHSKHQKTLSITNNMNSSTKVIHSINGQLQEFHQPVTAGSVLTTDHQPDMFFLCNSEDMFVNCHVPHVPPDEELQMGQLYFIMPISKLYKIVTLHEICLLAIKASSVLEKSSEGFEKKKKMSRSGTTSLSGRRKRNGGVRRKETVDFQVALKRL